MNTLVNNMSPAGNTNQAIGLQLGWLSLVGGGPFTVPPMDPNYQYTEVIILLTDGLNTQNRWYSTQDRYRCIAQAMTCANIKAADIDLYTIQVNTGGDPTSTLLQNCASSTGQVLPVDVGGPDDRDLQHDRYQSDQAARRSIVAAQLLANKKPGSHEPGFAFQNA